ncbi:MAG: metal-dependent transcriptional regulator [Flavobacteriales bacterium]
MASQTEENYLKAMFTLTNEKGEVNMSDVSNFLKVSKPSANNMVKNLEKQGYVNYEKYKPVSLTSKGKKTAALVIRKHRLTEMYLVEKMGFGWEEVHQIAEQVEHINSVTFFERMDELLGHPEFDPHGSPIPDKAGNIFHRKKQALSSLPVGSRGKLIALAHSSEEFLSYLNSRKIKLGSLIEIKAIETYDGSLKVLLNDQELSIFSKKVAERLLVEIV